MKRLSGLIAGAVLALTGCGGANLRETAATLGVAGGALTLSSGVELRVPAGALKQDTPVTLREFDLGGRRHIEVEPRGLALAVRGEVEVRVREGVALTSLQVREDGHAGEVEPGRRREDAARQALEIEVEHLGELEVGDGRGTDTRPDDHGADAGPDDHGGGTQPGDDHGGR
jgi:hypothetical protein